MNMKRTFYSMATLSACAVTFFLSALLLVACAGEIDAPRAVSTDERTQEAPSVEAIEPAEPTVEPQPEPPETQPATAEPTLQAQAAPTETGAETKTAAAGIDSEPEVPWPSPRIHPTMFHDPASQRILMFSGMSAMQRRVDLNEVWSFETAGATWELVGHVEPTDSLISFGFDEQSGQVVSLNNMPRETWAYDLAGNAWEMRDPVEKPIEDPFLGRRFGAPMAYDSESDRLILFGGGAPGMLHADTWAYDYDNDSWEQMNPESGPSPRAMTPMAYDAESDRILLWGGFMEPDLDDIMLWAYDYNNDSWESLESVDGPQTHWERHGMVYIPEQDRMILFSGMQEYADVMLGPETWSYDYNANSWRQIETENSPPAMAMYSMVYDLSAGKVVLFGGELTGKYATNLNNDIWIFDPYAENWSQVAAPNSDQP